MFPHFPEEISQIVFFSMSVSRLRWPVFTLTYSGVCSLNVNELQGPTPLICECPIQCSFLWSLGSDKTENTVIEVVLQSGAFIYGGTLDRNTIRWFFLYLTGAGYFNQPYTVVITCGYIYHWVTQRVTWFWLSFLHFFCDHKMWLSVLFTGANMNHTYWVKEYMG